MSICIRLDEAPDITQASEFVRVQTGIELEIKEFGTFAPCLAKFPDGKMGAVSFPRARGWEDPRYERSQKTRQLQRSCTSR